MSLPLLAFLACSGIQETPTTDPSNPIEVLNQQYIHEHPSQEIKQITLFFKVPSLRNIANTGHYFHDGEVPTLEEAVSIMAEVQLGKEFKTDEVQDLVAFLNTMNEKIIF